MRWFNGITDAMYEFEQTPGESEAKRLGMQQSMGPQQSD